MSKYIDLYLNTVLPASLGGYLWVSVIVLFSCSALLAVFAITKSKRLRQRNLPEGEKGAICTLSLLAALLWPILVTAGPVFVAVIVGVLSILRLTGFFVSSIMRVMKCK